MSTLRARDVLDQAQGFHARLASHFASLGSTAENERARLLFSWLSQHEEKISHFLHRYLGDAPASLLDAWLQNVPEEHALSHCTLIDLSPGADANEIISASRHYDDYLMRLYVGMRDQATRSDVREMFDSLIKMEDAERHRISMNLQTLYDW